jgi:hypothetical protein
MMQAFLFLGIMSISTFASAEGLLTSTVTNTTELVDSVAEETVEQDEEAETTSITTDETEDDTGNIVDKLVSSTAETVAEVEDNVLPKSSIKVKTDVIQVDVSKNIDVKVEAGSIDVELSDDGVNTDTSKLEAEGSSVKVNTFSIQGQKEDVTEEFIKVEATEPAIDENSTSDVKVAEVKPSLEESTVENNTKTAQADTTPVSRPPLSSRGELIAVVVSQNVPTSSTNTSNGFSVNSLPWGLVYSLQQATVSINPVQHGQNKTYYDQWLNAPPSPPPKASLLLKKV